MIPSTIPGCSQRGPRRQRSDRLRLPARVGAALMGLAAAGCGAASVKSLGDGVYRAKCKGSADECELLARETCGGRYEAVDRDSHAGGVASDTLPGPVTWHTVTFQCQGDEVAAEPDESPAQSLAAEARRRFRRDYIALDCDQNRAQGMEVEQCGATVHDVVWSEKAVARFFIRVCKLEPAALAKPVPDACAERLWKKWFARLAERYFLMALPEVLERCDGYPEECQDLETFERWCLESHDRKVEARWQSEQREIARLRDAAARERRAAVIEEQAAADRRALDESRRLGEVLGQFGARLRGRPVFRCSADGMACWQD